MPALTQRMAGESSPAAGSGHVCRRRPRTQLASNWGGKSPRIRGNAVPKILPAIPTRRAG